MKILLPILAALFATPSLYLPQDSEKRSGSGDTLKYAFGCYYLMDDKYEQNPYDSLKVKTWILEKLEEIEANGIGKNIFDHNGGGPNGAEWNPMNDLLLVMTLSESFHNDSSLITINGEPLWELPVTRFESRKRPGILLYTVLPLKTWESKLRDIKPADYSGLFKTKNIDSLKRHAPHPLNQGKIIELKWMTPHQPQLLVLKQYFHCDFGE